MSSLPPTDLHQPRIFDFETREQFEKQAAGFILESALDAVAEEGNFRVAFSGGSTPLPIYKNISNDPIFPWESSEVYQVDERFVPKESNESNQAQFEKSVSEETLGRIKEYHPFTVSGSVEASVREYEEKLESLDEPLFDLVVLGIGEDGHIASLFPGSSELKEVGTSFVTSAFAPKSFAGSQRLTLTLKAILSSQKVVVLLSGFQKQSVVTELIEGNKHVLEFPAKWLLQHPNLFIYQYLGDETV